VSFNELAKKEVAKKALAGRRHPRIGPIFVRRQPPAWIERVFIAPLSLMSVVAFFVVLIPFVLIVVFVVFAFVVVVFGL
jgi:hypothetical protein